MIFSHNRLIEEFGERIGYVVGYFLFTTILYFILLFLKKIPESWSYPHIMSITILIALLGFSISKLLK